MGLIQVSTVWDELTKHYMDRQYEARRNVCDSMKDVVNTVLPLGESLSGPPFTLKNPNLKQYKQD